MDSIIINSKEEIAFMRTSCKLAARLLSHVGALVKPGVTTQSLDAAAERYTQLRGAISAPLGYGPKQNPFPKSICTSINEVICHGIPSESRVLEEGDIINIDVSPLLNDFHGDTSRTFAVGTISEEAQKLIDVTRECLRLAIATVKPGSHVGDIGEAIQNHAESNGFSVVREFVGHGIGRVFHCPPNIPHFGIAGTGLELQAGMIFTIEPMINEGVYEHVMLEDGWTAITADGKLSAQFEHTILVTPNGVEVLTEI